MTNPEDMARRMDELLTRMEAAPGRPFSQAEIDEVRESIATFNKIVGHLTALGWFGRWALWILGTVVLLMSQWDALRARFFG